MGLAAGNETPVILQRAILAMLVCLPVGWGFGAIAQRAVQDRIDAYKKARPLPTDEEPAGEPAAPAGEEEIVATVEQPGSN
jgi:hypothetical protein